MYGRCPNREVGERGKDEFPSKAVEATWGRGPCYTRSKRPTLQERGLEISSKSKAMKR
jgi:hypothetical protein